MGRWLIERCSQRVYVANRNPGLRPAMWRPEARGSMVAAASMASVSYRLLLPPDVVMRHAAVIAASLLTAAGTVTAQVPSRPVTAADSARLRQRQDSLRRVAA